MDNRNNHNSFELILSTLEIRNNTAVTNQTYFISTYLSTLTITDLSISNIEINNFIFTISSSTLSVDGLLVFNII